VVQFSDENRALCKLYSDKDNKRALLLTTPQEYFFSVFSPFFSSILAGSLSFTCDNSTAAPAPGQAQLSAPSKDLAFPPLPNINAGCKIQGCVPQCFGLESRGVPESVWLQF
jgi:hypothetical protein